MTLSRIISGGQTGADQGALHAALQLGLSTGGFMPRGFRVESGDGHAIAQRFGLQETRSPEYRDRTRMNISSSDGTLIFGNLRSPGCSLTIRYCRFYAKPHFLSPWPGGPSRGWAEFRPWLDLHQITTLNVAGNRESRNPGIWQAVQDFLLSTLREAP